MTLTKHLHTHNTQPKLTKTDNKKHTVTYCHLATHPKHYHHQQLHKETKHSSPIALHTVSFIPSHKNNTLNTFTAY